MGNTQQSNVIFFFIVVAFVIFITMRGKLPIYLGFLIGGSSNASASSSADSNANPFGQILQGKMPDLIGKMPGLF